MENIVTYRHFGSDNFDIIAGSYSCMIRRYSSGEFRLHIHAKGQRCPDLVLRPDAGFTPEAAPYRLLTQMSSCSEKTDMLELTYGCEDKLETAVRFYPDRLEMSATYTGAEPVMLAEAHFCTPTSCSPPPIRMRQRQSATTCAPTRSSPWRPV